MFLCLCKLKKQILSLAFLMNVVIHLFRLTVYMNRNDILIIACYIAYMYLACLYFFAIIKIIF